MRNVGLKLNLEDKFSDNPVVVSLITNVLTVNHTNKQIVINNNKYSKGKNGDFLCSFFLTSSLLFLNVLLLSSCDVLYPRSVDEGVDKGDADEYGVVDDEGDVDEYGVTDDEGDADEYGVADDEGDADEYGVADDEGDVDEYGVADDEGDVDEYGVADDEGEGDVDDDGLVYEGGFVHVRSISGWLPSGRRVGTPSQGFFK